MLTKELLPIIEQCTDLLASNNLTIAFAESASAGSLAYAFSQTSRAGEVLKGGLVCYDACLKEDVLLIPKEIIDKFTPESIEVTSQMALKLPTVIESDISVAITGLPRPGGSETPEKPVGTMFFSILFNGTLTERKMIFSGEPDVIIYQLIKEVAKALIHLMRHNDRVLSLR